MPTVVKNDLALRLIIPIIAAAVVGAWGYSTTRASESDVSALQARHHTDVDRIEEEMEVEGRRIREEIGDLKDSVHAIDKEQSAFRGQVREALRIPHD